MKKKSLWSIVMILCLLLQLGGVSAYAAGGADTAVSQGCHSLNAQLPLGGTEQKVETAQAAILYELNTDTLLYAYHPDKQINPTGLVKLLTALVALETVSLEDEVTVKRSVLDTVAIGSVSAGLKAGEIVTVRDLLLCIMVASANDASAVLANYIGGTQAEFANMLNEKALSLGCTGSNFVNAHGLKAEGQYSTARDLAIIAEAALENEQFTEMFEAKNCVIPATNKSDERKFNTTNHMMSDAIIQTQVDARVTGGKPAAASNTDRSMICTAEVGTSRYLCVVISAAAEVSQDGLSVTRWNIFEEVSFLFDFGFANFAVRQVIERDQALYQYAVFDGEEDVVLQPAQSVSVVLPLNYDAQQLQYSNVVDANLLHAPIKQGDVLGTLQVRYGNICVGECDLLAMHSVQSVGSVIQDAERIEKPDVQKDSFLWRPVLIWAGVIIGIALVLWLAVFIAIRLASNAKLRAQHRRRARNRRRNRT